MGFLCDDVLTEIINILDPIDILDLSLTCRQANKVAYTNKYFKMFRKNLKFYDTGYYHTVIIDKDECYKYDHENNKLEKLEIKNVRSVTCGAYYTILHTKTGVYKLDVYGIYMKIHLDNILIISSGTDTTFILTKNGLYSIGVKYYYKGHNIDGNNQSTKLNIDYIKNIDDILQISCGKSHVIILTKEGLYGFGSDNNLQLNLCNFYRTNPPQPIEINSNDKTLSVHCSDDSTLVFGMLTNTIITFGCNDKGQLGQNNAYVHCIADVVDLPNKSKIKSISYKAEICVFVIDNTLYGFGRNYEKQLINHYQQIQYKSVKMVELTDLVVESVRCGKAHTIVKTADGYYNFNKGQYDKIYPESVFILKG